MSQVGARGADQVHSVTPSRGIPLAEIPGKWPAVQDDTRAELHLKVSFRALDVLLLVK